MNFVRGDEVKCIKGYYCGETGIVQTCFGNTKFVIRFKNRTYDVPVRYHEIRKLAKLDKALK